MSQSASAPAPASNPAQIYEDYFVANQFRPWTAELLDRANPQPGERVLDIACGTGIVARLLAQRLSGQARITGLDPSPLMLGVAHSAAEREGARIEFHEGKAEAIPFPDGSFDLVTIQQGLQYFQDKATGLKEIRRVLAPGGRVASSTWTEIENSPFNLAFAEVIQRHLGTPAMHTPFALGNQELLRSLFVDAGFTDIEIDVVGLDVRMPEPDRFVDLGVAGVSAAVPELQTMSEAERVTLAKAIRSDLQEPLRGFTNGNVIVAPMQAHIVVARTSG